MARVLLEKESGQWALRIPKHSTPHINQVDADGNSASVLRLPK
jgi:hypothetical protein